MATDAVPEKQRSGWLALGVCAWVALFGIAALVGSLAGSRSRSTSQYDGHVIAIRSVYTGHYLEVTPDGLLRPTANSSSVPAARFGASAVPKSLLNLLKPRPVGKSETKQTTRRGCKCSGFSDAHGFGRFCYHWESEWHRPWCYVSDDCPGARKEAHRVHRHQSCNTEEGYLGPEGYNPPKGCSCSGLESVHGFGAYCKGWEFPGQLPWCYVADSCTADGTHGSLGAKFVDCVSNITAPPPPPSPPPDPPSPPPPPPPPAPWVASRDGWGTPKGCECNGYSNKHGYGAYCKAWEVPDQQPWCYVDASCPHMSRGGNFKHRRAH